MAKPRTPEQHEEALRTGRITVDQFCGTSITAEVGVFEYHYDIGSDGITRYGMLVTYGNPSMVHGPGCDASGQRLDGPEFDSVLALIDGAGA